MTTRGRALRFTAISALVVLSLTGSTGRHGHGSDGSGGGCSSRPGPRRLVVHLGRRRPQGRRRHLRSGGSGYHDHDDDTYGDDTGGGSGETEGAVLNLITCVMVDQPWSTVEVSNPNAVEQTVPVTVLFKDADGTTIDEGTEEVTVPADGVSAVRVPFDGSGTPTTAK
ncbi:hypothetical protein ACRAS1_37620 [Streptomyces lividans]